jgi:hypothetical protein
MVVVSATVTRTQLYVRLRRYALETTLQREERHAAIWLVSLRSLCDERSTGKHHTDQRREP